LRATLTVTEPVLGGTGHKIVEELEMEATEVIPPNLQRVVVFASATKPAP
jgi:hypothetical protein